MDIKIILKEVKFENYSNCFVQYLPCNSLSLYSLHSTRLVNLFDLVNSVDFDLISQLSFLKILIKVKRKTKFVMGLQHTEFGTKLFRFKLNKKIMLAPSFHQLLSKIKSKIVTSLKTSLYLSCSFT